LPFVAGPTISRMHSPTAPAPGGKGDRTRRRLLDIAIRRFANDGFRRTSVSDIAREAGVTPATTYAYFAGKEALFEAAVDADAATLIEEARSTITGETVRDRWLPWLGVLVAGLGRHPLAARVLGGGEPEVLPRLLDIPSLAELREELAADLQAGQQKGEVRADVDATAMAMGIETFVLSLLMGYLQAGQGQMEERALGVVALLDAALKPLA
jgi:AcrR family transcriptional regulator